MIQRIQSFYLLVAVVLLIWASFKVFFILNGGAIVLDGFTAHYGDGQKIFSTLPLNIILWLSALLSFIAIFLFKNRILQMRLTTYVVIILLGYYLLLVFYRYYGFKKIAEITSSQMSIYAVFPVIAAIFVYLANRAIKKDEEKVRSMDRFRD